MSGSDYSSILRTAGLLSGLDDTAIETVTEIAEQRCYSPEGVVVAQGEHGDAFFVIVSGSAQVTQETADGKRVVLKELGPGDSFGEMALTDESNRRSATVTALGPLKTLCIPASHFRALLVSHPKFDERVRTAVEHFLRENLLAHSAEFGVLDPEQRSWLAERVELREFAAGELLMREGEAGDRCYVIAQGRVEIVRRGPDGSERHVGEVGPGALLGEAALLTDAPRTASVRTLESGRALALDRAVLLQALGEHELNERVIELLRHRAWPRRVAGVEVFEHLSPEGDTVSVLRNAANGSYHRLSAEGRFIWDRLDGQHNMRDLTLAFIDRFGIFAPERIVQLVMLLARRGFVESASVKFDSSGSRGSGLLGLVARAQALARWTRAVSGLDPWVTRVYESGARYLFAKPVIAGFALLTVLGGVVTVRQTIELGAGQIYVTLPTSLLLAFVPLLLLSILVHEAAHALTVKHYGRVVDRGGIGLYFLIPIFYVDTSDMWVLGRWPRIAVSIAGPAASAVCGSVAALIAAYAAWSDAVVVLFWQLAIVSYTLAIANLNPLLELDGYYVLIDYLERPNLRRDALRFVGKSFGISPPKGGSRRPDLVDAGYGFAAALYLLLLCYAILLTHRLFLEGWLSRALSPEVSTIIAWALVILAVGANLLALLGELRR